MPQHMLKQYEELAVLEQGDDGAIVSIREQSGPSVLLGAAYIAHLDRVLARAVSELSSLPPRAGMKLLCAEIQTLLATYEETCNKFEGGGAPTATRSLVSALEELEVLRRRLDELR